MSETGILSDYLDRDALARELNCAGRTIARYEAEPDGLPSVMIAGKRYYRIAAVREFLTKRERKPNPRRVA
jgi:hypothetical protein